MTYVGYLRHGLADVGVPEYQLTRALALAIQNIKKRPLQPQNDTTAELERLAKQIARGYIK
jgi:hypothetical protein